MINRQLEDPAISEKVKKWRMTVVLQTDYYGLSLIFDEAMRIESGAVTNPTLIATTTFYTILMIAKGKVSLLKSVLDRSVRIKGLFRHPIAAFRFYRLMNQVLKR
jgi:hypothetical protein